jgi:hypothetical protein
LAVAPVGSTGCADRTGHLGRIGEGLNHLVSLCRRRRRGRWSMRVRVVRAQMVIWGGSDARGVTKPMAAAFSALLDGRP